MIRPASWIRSHTLSEVSGSVVGIFSIGTVMGASIVGTTVASGSGSESEPGMSTRKIKARAATAIKAKANMAMISRVRLSLPF